MDHWLETRTPAPPAALRARVVDALRLAADAGGDRVGGALGTPAAASADRVAGAPGTRAGASPDAIADECIAAAERLLRALLRDDCATRSSALDLLAADALATYAFEAAAESPAELPARAAAALRRIALLGAASPA